MSEYTDRLVDDDALRRYLTEQLGAVDNFEYTYHEEGHSNETLFLAWGDWELVLRRPPPGETADTAHDVLREYKIYSKLEDTSIPVPKTVLACRDESVLGCEFYLMERVQGGVIDQVEPERFADHKHRETISEEFIDTLVEIHTLDYESAGLDDLGHPDGFTQRQVDRWTDQFEWACERTSDHREIPAFKRARDWLQDNVPEWHEHTLVHGDFTLDNSIFAPGTPPRIAAVIDWEMGTLGDPFTDLGWTFVGWRDPKDPEPEAPELLSSFLDRDGYFTRREFVERYERQTGFSFDNDRFYRAFGYYKLAIAGEMFLARHLAGDGDDPLYVHMESEVPHVIDHAIDIIDGEHPL